jgi:ABC-type Co2+ transport system permease subunit
MINTHYTDTKASIAGAVCSILGANFFHFAADALSAFSFGVIGALGGWIFNKLIKKYEASKEIQRKDTDKS